MSRKSYPPEFKEETVSLILDQGYSYAQAQEATGVGLTALRRWVSQLRQERQGVTPSKGNAISLEHRRIQELEAQVKKTRKGENDLKKGVSALDVGGVQRFAMMDKLRAHYTQNELCRVFAVARSSYVYHTRHRVQVKPERARLRQCVIDLHQASRSSAGSRTLSGQLKHEGEMVGRYKVRSLMREAGLLRKHLTTTL